MIPMPLNLSSTPAMKLIAIVALLTSLCPLFAADDSKKAADPLSAALFPPELVFMARDKIGLTQEQQEAFRARMENVQSRSDELRTKLERETAALAALVKQERVDEKAVITQLDKVLDAEREVKHLHVGLAVAMKNLLTPEQQAKLREIAKDGGTQLGADIRRRLTEKMERVQASAQKMAQSGRDPSDILGAMEEKFKPLMDAGKVIEAEAELDRALEQLAK
jgi:Spy/CpxP family protein refolding chaperone